MKANIKQQIYIYDQIVNAKATVDEDGIDGYLTYEQMAEIVEYLKAEITMH